MRCLFVASGMNVPSTRFRILPYLPWLRQAGHQCDLAISWPEKYDYHPWLGWRVSQWVKRQRRVWQVWRAAYRHYDAIVIEREIFDNSSYDLELKLRQYTPRLLLDVDDGIFLKFPEKYEVLAKTADEVLCGNEYLMDYTRPYNSQVTLLPTCVELKQYPLRKIDRLATAKPTIGWIGTTQNVALLSVCATALRNLGKRFSFRLLIVAPAPDRLAEIDLTGVEVDFQKWNPETELRYLHQMDIGLMPLPSNEPWMKYKCGLKLIQYLAVGIPGVASPIGVNESILAGNRVGFAATLPEEWEKSLAELLETPQLRWEMGRAGRELVEQKYSIEQNWQVLERSLQPR